jgi:hypothetical protein
MYHGEPEVEFFRQVPTVWDETKVINGEIGKFATVARRSGDARFIGPINNSEPRQLKLPLNFLKAGKNYTARIYSDNNSVPTRTHVAVETRTVNSLATLDVPLHAAGGQAVWITLEKQFMIGKSFKFLIGLIFFGVFVTCTISAEWQPAGISSAGRSLSFGRSAIKCGASPCLHSGPAAAALCARLFSKNRKRTE